MVACAVFGCNSNNNKKLKKILGEEIWISFFSFPKHSDDLCQIWISKCSRSDEFNIKNSRICSKHFNENDFERNLKYELLNIPNAPKKLKAGAIPTINLYNTENPKQILNKRKNKLVVSKLLSLNETESEKQNHSLQNIIPLEPNLHFSKFGDIPPTIKEETYHKKMNLFKENENLKTEIEKLRKQSRKVYEKLKTENYTLQNRIKEMKKKEISFIILEKSLQKMFTPGQISKMKTPQKKIIHWRAMDIAYALDLYAAGPRAYRWMQKNNYPLPGEATLRRCKNKIDISLKTNKRKINKIF